MSYDIIHAIKIKNNKVEIKSCCNNVYPRTPHVQECISLSRIFQEKGKQALELEIMKEYESGNFQAGAKNKYHRALKILLHDPEYESYDWRKDVDDTKRESKEFDALLMEALSAKLPKEKFMITKIAENGRKVYFVMRKNSNSCRWYEDIEKAKCFDYETDAEKCKKWFTSSEVWNIEKI